MLQPLEQWVCDTCGEVIRSAKEGWLEYLRDLGDATPRVHSFRIVHHAAYSPRRPADLPRGARAGLDERCSVHDKAAGRQDDHLERYLGSAGLTRLLVELDWGPLHDPDERRGVGGSPRELVEVIRRLHVPHYEEARRYFQRARAEGELGSGDPYYQHHPETLRQIVEEYGRP